MKKVAPLFIVVSMLFAFSGCAFFNQIYPAPAAPVCSKPEAVDSVLCAISLRINYSPEQLNSAFLDAELVGLGMELFEADELELAIEKVRKYVVEKKLLTVDGLVKYITKEAKLNPYLAALASRHMDRINLPDLGIKTLTAYDIELIIIGLDSQLEQLSWF